jgi:hypothetical protein
MSKKMLDIERENLLFYRGEVHTITTSSIGVFNTRRSNGHR